MPGEQDPGDLRRDERHPQLLVRRREQLRHAGEDLPADVPREGLGLHLPGGQTRERHAQGDAPVRTPDPQHRGDRSPKPVDPPDGQPEQRTAGSTPLGTIPAANRSDLFRK